MKQIILSLSVILFLSCSNEKSSTKSPIDVNSVKTDAGYISGYLAQDSMVKIFKGVPFAAPPVGELRWKAPVPVQPWEGIKKCEVFAASALQNKPAPFMMWSKEFMAPEAPLSEDCLYLNIWTAAEDTSEKRPVIVWIHGGAFTSGSGSVPLYDGEEMAKKGVVFVTINYRLGIFGFFAHPELSKESPDSVSGNYGILDQIAALKWVRNNIKAFGGNPDNVTIDGQSAGAFSVNALMISPLASGLFHRAIAQSGGMFGKNLLSGSDLKTAEKKGIALAKQLKADSINDLRAMSADKILNAGNSFSIVIDNFVIPVADDIYNASKQNDVPLITGWNADEIGIMNPLKAGAFRTEVGKTFGGMTTDFLKLFPASNDEEAAESQKILSVLRFGWQNYKWASLQSAKGKNKAYLYYFNYVPPGEPNYGAFHSAEFAYALKTLRNWNKPFTGNDHKLADIMSSYWVNFAKTGNPNGENLPEWPAFEPQSAKVMEFSDSVKAIDLPSRAQLEFLDKYEESLSKK